MKQYLAYLNNYDIRPCVAQYLWVYCLLLNRLPQSYFVLNSDYINMDNYKKWELNSSINKPIPYSTDINILPEDYCLLDKVEDLLISDIPSKVLNTVIKDNIEYYKNQLSTILDNKNIKGALLWVNNKTVEELFKERNLPVIHNEIGALRKPLFKDMCYFDFHGVNGNTEFNNRFENFEKISHKVKIYSREELIKIIAPDNYDYLISLMNKKPQYKCGVGLQVDLDTNLLAFNNNIQPIDILNLAVKNYGNVLVRNHPASSTGYISNKSIGRTIIDNSKNSLEFIANCENVWCMNSSVGFEALLLGRNVRFFGDTPFYNMQYMDEETKLKALNFAIFSYMIPTELLYNEKYYDYRIEIGLSDEEELYNKGYENILK